MSNIFDEMVCGCVMDDCYFVVHFRSDSKYEQKSRVLSTHIVDNFLGSLQKVPEECAAVRGKRLRGVGFQ